jgi:hypothetical protein
MHHSAAFRKTFDGSLNGTQQIHRPLRVDQMSTQFYRGYIVLLFDYQLEF